MKVLLWKDYRENLYKVLLGLGACLAVHLLRLNERFNAEFSDDVDAWALSFGLVAAPVFAMEMLAGEKNRGTLDFLLIRPLAPAHILAMKFLVGAAGLLIVMTGFWLMAYATPIVPVEGSRIPPVAAAIMLDVGMAAMIQIWFLPMLVAYSLAFLGSAATSDPVKAVAAGALVLYGLGLALFMLMRLGLVTKIWLDPIVGIHFNSMGSLVRIAEEEWLRARSIAVVAAVCAALYAIAVLKITRLRAVTLEWRLMLAIAVAGVAVPVASWAYSDDEIEAAPPAGVLALGKPTRDLAIVGDTAYVLSKNQLRVVDIARVDSMVERSILPLAGWSAHRVQPVGEFIAVVGTRRTGGADSVVVAVLGAAGPGSFEMLDAMLLQPCKERMRIGIDKSGERLFLATGEIQHSSVIALQVGDDGRLEKLDELRIEREPAFDEAGKKIYTYSFGSYGILPYGLLITDKIPIEVSGDHLFIGLANGLAIVGIHDHRELNVASSVRLEPANRRSGEPRPLVVNGDTVIVERQWPREMVAVDVSDPQHPLEIGWLDRRNVYNHARAAGDYLMEWFYDSVRLYSRFGANQRQPLEVISLPQPYSVIAAAPAVANGHLFVARGKELHAFRSRVALR